MIFFYKMALGAWRFLFRASISVNFYFDSSYWARKFGTVFGGLVSVQQSRKPVTAVQRFYKARPFLAEFENQVQKDHKMPLAFQTDNLIPFLRLRILRKKNQAGPPSSPPDSKGKLTSLDWGSQLTGQKLLFSENENENSRTVSALNIFNTVINAK